MSIPTYNGRSLPILTLPPDWDKDPVLRVIESTTVSEALDQSEERWQRYPRPLYGLTYTSTAIDSRQQGFFRKLFETAEALPFGVPLWTEAVRLAADSDAGATTLFTTDSTGTLFSIADYLIVWSDWQTWEVVKCDRVVFSGYLTLIEATSKSWKAGASVMPVLFGYCKRPDFSALDAEDSSLDIEFEERFLLGRFKRETPIIPGAPVLSYSDCGTTCTVDFGATIPGLKRFLVETSTDGTTWHHYTMAKRSRSRLVFNNYFGGARYVRVSFIWLDLSVTVGVFTFRPAAAVLQPPVISVSGLNAPLFALPANYQGASGIDGSTVLVVADQEQIDYNGLPILKVPVGEAFVEATKQDYRLNAWSDPQTPSTMAVTVTTEDAGATVKFTIDGTDPSLSNGHDSGYVISPYLASFGCVIIARAFKDGCASPPTFLLIDKAIEMQDQFETKVGAIGSSASCDMFNWQRQPNPEDPASDCVPLPTRRSCWDLYGSNSPSGILAAWIATLTGSDSGPAEHLAVYIKDTSATPAGATSDPGTCSSGSNWTDGTLIMGASIQSVETFQTAAQVSHSAELTTFPNSLTCIYAKIVSDDPESHGAFQIVKDRTTNDFFGPTRGLLSWIDNPIDFYTGGTAKGSILAIAIVMLMGLSPAYAIRLSELKLVCTLAPTNAPDLWNSDDAT